MGGGILGRLARLGSAASRRGSRKSADPPAGPTASPGADPPTAPPTTAPPTTAPPAPAAREAADAPADVAVREILGGAQDAHNAEFEEFLDERVLVSRDALGKKEMKIKVVEVTDEHPPSKWKLGDRVKARRILVTIKHLEDMRVEEAEFDIESIERELAEKRHYTSSNRWIPTSEIRNGYVLKSRHMSLISDAVALDYISF